MSKEKIVKTQITILEGFTFLLEYGNFFMGCSQQFQQYKEKKIDSKPKELDILIQ